MPVQGTRRGPRSRRRGGAQKPKVDQLGMFSCYGSTSPILIPQLNRELAELESLVESKIYREAELESTIADLQRSNEKWKAKAGTASGQSAAAPSTTAPTDSNDRCELCEGDHDLDTCPVFSGNLDSGETGFSPLNYKHKDKVWCQDCEVSVCQYCPLLTLHRAPSTGQRIAHLQRIFSKMARVYDAFRCHHVVRNDVPRGDRVIHHPPGCQRDRLVDAQPTASRLDYEPQVL